MKKKTECLGKQSAIQLVKNISTSSKFQLPQARIVPHETKQTVYTICAYENNQQSNLSTIFAQAQNSNCLSKEFCVTKENRLCTLWMPRKTICTPIDKEYFHRAQNSNCLKEEFSITKENRECTPVVSRKTICNPIDQEYFYKL